MYILVVDAEAGLVEFCYSENPCFLKRASIFLLISLSKSTLQILAKIIASSITSMISSLRFSSLNSSGRIFLFDSCLAISPNSSVK